MWDEFVYGLRKVRNDRLSSVLFVLLLTIGISTSAVVGGLLNSLVFKSLPVHDPGSLLLLEKNHARQVRPETGFSYREFELIQKRTDLFSDAVAEQPWVASDPVRLGLRRVKASAVSPNYFSSLGLHALKGRVLTEADAKSLSPIPVMLSYQFSGDDDVVGKQFNLNKVPVVVVGVLQRDFHSLDVERAPDVWLPISAVPNLRDDGNLVFQILVRLAPGMSRESAVLAIAQQLHEEEERWWRLWSARAVPPYPAAMVDKTARYLHESRFAFVPAGRGISLLRDKFSQALYLLAGAAGLLWLMVCTSIGGLLLVKGAARGRELAIRLALGASRGRLVRELFFENLSLVVAAVALSLWLAFQLSGLVLGLLPEVRSLNQELSPKIISIAPDMRVGLCVLGLSLISVLACGILPAMRAKLSVDLIGAPLASARKTPGLLLLLASQIAFATVLLTFAALFLRTFWGLAHTDPGFDAAHVVEFVLDSPDAAFDAAFLRNLEWQAAELPAVHSVAFSTVAVMRGIGIKTTLAPAGVVLPRNTFLNSSFNVVTPGYFDAMGIPLLRGRNIEDGDVKKEPEPIVVNRAFASAFFPREDAIGKVLVGGTDGTNKTEDRYVIVGLVANAKYRSIREQNAPVYYVQLNIRGHVYGRQIYMYVRTPAAQIANEVRGIVKNLNSSASITEVATLEERVEKSLWQERLITLLSGVFGIAALILGAAGIYGALGYSIARRARELGIRMALGALPWQIARTVYWQIVVAVSAGLFIGAAISALLVRFASGLLYAVNALDPISFGGAIALVSIGALAAGVQPTWRLSRIEPLLVLREE